jgi:hypothetical protein
MAFLAGVGPDPVLLSGPAQAQGSYAPGAVSGGTTDGMAAVIDGTPVRVVVLALSAAAGLVALHWAGFRFSLGVSA